MWQRSTNAQRAFWNLPWQLAALARVGRFGASNTASTVYSGVESPLLDF